VPLTRCQSPFLRLDGSGSASRATRVPRARLAIYNNDGSTSPAGILLDRSTTPATLLRV